MWLWRQAMPPLSVRPRIARRQNQWNHSLVFFVSHRSWTKRKSIHFEDHRDSVIRRSEWTPRQMPDANMVRHSAFCGFLLQRRKHTHTMTRMAHNIFKWWKFNLTFPNQTKEEKSSHFVSHACTIRSHNYSVLTPSMFATQLHNPHCARVCVFDIRVRCRPTFAYDFMFRRFSFLAIAFRCRHSFAFRMIANAIVMRQTFRVTIHLCLISTR